MTFRRIMKCYEDERQRIIDNDPPFPEFIRLLRQALGLKLNAASDYCEISRHQLSRLEHGKVVEPPEDLRVEALAELYDIPVWLIKKKFYEYVGSKQGKTRCQKINPCGSTREKEIEARKS